MQQASSSSSLGSLLPSVSGISSSCRGPSSSSSAWRSGSSGTWETWRCRSRSCSPAEIYSFFCDAKPFSGNLDRKAKTKPELQGEKILASTQNKTQRYLRVKHRNAHVYMLNTSDSGAGPKTLCLVLIFKCKNVKNEINTHFIYLFCMKLMNAK